MIIFQAHENAVFDVAWVPNEMKLLTVSGDHLVRLFDASGASSAFIQEFTGHERTVKTAVFAPENKGCFFNHLVLH